MPWNDTRVPMVEDRISKRLQELSSRLGDRKWLNGEFSAGDLLMVQVLRRLKDSAILNSIANLHTYVTRGEARPAFQRAFAAQRVTQNPDTV